VRLFLLDDDARIRKMVAEMVETLGHRVVAEATECDLAILDINVGGHRSIQVGETLHERGIPLIFSSCYVSEMLPKRLSRYQKPLTKGKLSAAIDLIFAAS
jgi:hypothetical protein